MSSKKIIRLTFRPRRPDAGIPINLLHRKLTSFQKALLALGEHQLFGELKERGRLPENVLNNYTLEVVAFKPGSLSVNVTLSGEQLPIFPQYDPDRQLDELVNIIENISDKEKIQSLIPDSLLRKRVLRNIRNLAPDKEVPEVFINDLSLTNEYKDSIDAMLMPAITEKECELIGPVVEIRLIDNPFFGIATPYGIREFPLPTEFWDSISASLGNVVTVKYTAQIVESREKPLEIIEVVQMEGNIFSADEIVHQGLRFIFNESIDIQVSIEETLVVLENKNLGIVTYGPRFDQAWQSFQEDFVFLWEEIAQEKEDILEEKAKEVKNYLLHLVDKVEGTHCA